MPSSVLAALVPCARPARPVTSLPLQAALARVPDPRRAQGGHPGAVLPLLDCPPAWNAIALRPPWPALPSER
jgi:hypothetical protein